MIGSVSISQADSTDIDFSRESIVHKGIAWIRHYIPDLHTIQEVAFKAIQLVAVALLAYFLPWTSIIISMGCLMGHKVIQDINAQQFKTQLKHGMDHPACLKALKSIKSCMSIQKLFCEFDLVRLAAWAFMFHIHIPLCILLSGLQILIWRDNHELSKKVAKSKASQLDAYLCSDELHKLQKLYPNLPNNKLYPKCILEKERRPMKAHYIKWQKQCISNAWEDLLSQGKFEISQGLDGDYEIFDPLCRLAVWNELQTDLKLQTLDCPPTLRAHVDKLHKARAVLKQLSSEDLNILKTKLIEDDFNSSGKLHDISLKISDIASHMMQSQELFQKPIITASERYCWKHFKIIPFVKLQFHKLAVKKNHLFFKSDET